MGMEAKPILEVENLTTYFSVFDGFEKKTVKAVDGVSLSVTSGDTVAIIGESGCGKSTLALSILRVLPETATILNGKIVFDGEDLLQKNRGEMSKIRAEKIAMILQDPMMSLNPVFTIGNQVGETLYYHQGLRNRLLKDRIKELLLDVKIPEPESRMKQYPHEMSGGMRQRIVGAIALSCNPKLIMADEPTTNLDVTIQLQYLNLLRDLQEKTGVTLLFITHDLGIVAEMCKRVIVMYSGKVVERAPVTNIYDDPAHPYTKALLDAAFGLQDLSKRSPIKGEPPDLSNLPPGCHYHPRCERQLGICSQEEPPEIALSPDRTVKCWLFDPAHRKSDRMKH